MVTEILNGEKTVDDLVRSLKQNPGRYAFLIGAGTSKAAGIPTAKELIERWKEEIYEFENGDSERIPESWIKTKEESIDGDEKYGFWFNERYPIKADRRQFIRSLVEGTEPTFGIIVLATMMSHGLVPVTLTPNFDDLLYDSFYFFLEEKPLVIDHDSLAPQYRLTDDNPTIIKLHGDYLYDNLQNTLEETYQLRQNMKKALKRTLEEYGLVVLGYGGNDKSIMEALEGADISEYGLWWCKYADKEDGLSGKVKSLLSRSNRYTVEISGSEDLLTTLWYHFQEKLQSTMPNSADLIKKAQARGDKLRKTVKEQKLQSTGKEKEALDKTEDKDKALEKGYEAFRKEKYNEAIDAFSAAIDIDSSYVPAFSYRALAYHRKGDYKKAIEDVNTALQLDPSIHENYFNRGRIHTKLGAFKEAIKDYTLVLNKTGKDIESLQNRAELFVKVGKPSKALSDAEEALSLSNQIDQKAISLMLIVISKTLLGNKKSKEEKMYRDICSREFTTVFEFELLSNWLKESNIDNKNYIREIIDLLKEHKE